jgi:serine/threonine protein kinase
MQPATVGPYTVLRELGSGALGRVVLARTDKGARLAIKMFRPELAAYPQFRARLRQEIDAAGRVRGLRVAAVLDADPDAPVPWLATEYVDAPPLHEVIAAHGPMAPATARQMGIGLAEALASIHEVGAVHGDLKPGNVLLASDGPHVTDIGIARAAAATPLTRGGALIGTLGYLAPEQVVDGVVTPASDVFALGSLLLFAATWRRPFGEGDAVAVLDRVLHAEPDLSGLTGELATVVEACLTRNPDRRPGPEQVRETFVAAIRAASRAAAAREEAARAQATVSLGAAPRPRRGDPEPMPWPTAPARTRYAAPPPRRSRGRRIASATLVSASLVGVLAATSGDARADAVTVPQQRTATVAAQSAR